MKPPTNLFNYDTGIRQLQKLVTLRSDEMQAGRTNEHYLVFLNVTNRQQSESTEGWMTHHTDTNLLILLRPVGHTSKEGDSAPPPAIKKSIGQR